MKIKSDSNDIQSVIFKLASYIFLVVGFIIVSGSTVKAVSGPALSTTFPTNDRNGLGVYLTIGEGEFNVQSAGATILADSPGNVTVTIINAGWCNSGGLEVPITSLTSRPYKDTYFQAFDVYGSTGNYTPGTLRGRVDNLANTRECNASNLGVNKTMTFCVCSLIGSTGKYGVVILGSIAGKKANYAMGPVTTGWTFESSFRFQISSSIGAAMTLTPPGIPGVKFNFSNKLITTAQTLNTSFFLTTPCTYNDFASITFFDVDNGKYQQGPSPYTAILNFLARSRPSYSATYNQTHAQAQITGGNDVDGSSFTIPLEGSRHYEFQVNGLTKPNSIAFNLTANADTLFAAENCPKPLPTGSAQCTLTASTTTPAPGAEVQITATVTNRTSGTWEYNPALTDFNEKNFTISPVDYSTSYAKLSLPTVDQGTSPGSTTGPPDWNNGSFVVNKAGTNTTPYTLSNATFGNLVGPSGIVRFGMRQTVNVNASATFSFFVRAPATVGASRLIGARILDRDQVIYPYFWFNEYNPGGCTVRITSASPLSATCRFTSTPIIIEAGNYQPSVLVRNTSTVTGAFQPSFAITGKPTVTGPSTSIAAGVEREIFASSSVAFTSADERRWSMDVTITWSGGSTTCLRNFIDVVRKPFFNITNGDMLVGGEYPSGLPAACPGTLLPSNANAYSWAITGSRGANTEHVSKIFGTALEIYSAGTGYSSLPAAPLNNRWLTIANNNVANSWGGGSGGVTCMKDYYDSTKETATSPVLPLPASHTPGLDRQKEFNGSITLNGVSGFSGRQAVYVTGDVYIASNITMSTIYTSNNLVAGSSDVNKTPFFALIVKGNIYVSRNVTQLDGMYVAQPNISGGGGTIFTCAKNDTFQSYPAADLFTIPSTYFTNCGNRLTFNGIVQARKLRLHRTSGSLSTGVAAETFNNLPELYLTSTPFRDTTSDSAQYDSAATLPPLL